MVLVELIFLLGLISVAAVMSTQLYIEMSRDHVRMTAQREAQQRFDLALRPLRADVWNASAARVDEAGVLHLTTSGGSEIQWRAGEQLHRTSDKEPARQWDELVTTLSFSTDGKSVVLHEEPSQDDRAGGEITLPMIASRLKGQTP